MATDCDCHERLRPGRHCSWCDPEDVFDDGCREADCSVCECCEGE
ncbi:hypothetical protein J4U00_gp110 [Mycobacterium phage DyoEdafos]|uniref:Uncharacterized protein n=1 Tax=Mycobacterium phage DyoEdafos TaxID=2599860 RepID=A0A5J6THB7_9CAUD|nr:hypothetical protein J4U00_gp110 [Mycobacterium phage DyoEdafos]QFG10373.1 hypothetical protein SEA_DYOEDAFOS_110 [Mycobacterium phage DyoEdafos]